MVNTFVRSLIRAPNSNSSGAIKRMDPNILPISFTNGILCFFIENREHVADVGEVTTGFLVDVFNV